MVGGAFISFLNTPTFAISPVQFFKCARNPNLNNGHKTLTVTNKVEEPKLFVRSLTKMPLLLVKHARTFIVPFAVANTDRALRDNSR